MSESSIPQGMYPWPSAHPSCPKAKRKVPPSIPVDPIPVTPIMTSDKRLLALEDALWEMEVDIKEIKEKLERLLNILEMATISG